MRWWSNGRIIGFQPIDPGSTPGRRIQKMVNKNYVSSIALGLNDALIELTGALAGLTFALRNGKIISITGIIIGFVAALSMSASEYFSSREEKKRQNSIKKAFYTGFSYIITVLILVAPYIFIENVFNALALTIILSFSIIAFYTYFISTFKSQPFWKRFLQMTLISLSVAFISFLIGVILRNYFRISV